MEYCSPWYIGIIVLGTALKWQSLTILTHSLFITLGCHRVSYEAATSASCHSRKLCTLILQGKQWPGIRLCNNQAWQMVAAGKADKAIRKGLLQNPSLRALASAPLRGRGEWSYIIPWTVAFWRGVRSCFNLPDVAAGSQDWGSLHRACPKCQYTQRLRPTSGFDYKTGRGLWSLFWVSALWRLHAGLPAPLRTYCRLWKMKTRPCTPPKQHNLGDCALLSPSPAPQMNLQQGSNSWRFWEPLLLLFLLP